MHNNPVSSSSVINSPDDVKRIEQVPIEARLAGYQTTLDVFKRAAELYGDDPAITFLIDGYYTDEIEIVSYKQFLSKIIRAANCFHNLGVGRDDVVAYLLPNLPHTHYTLWGAQAVGIANPINHYLEPEHIAGILERVDARVLVVAGPSISPEIWEKVNKIRDITSQVETILVVGEEEDMEEGVLAFNRLLSSQSADLNPDISEASREDRALFLHTGGTTGIPKITPHTHFNALAAACSVSLATNTENTGERFVSLSGMPYFHVMAIYGAGLLPFIKGGSVVIAGPEGFRNRDAVSSFWKTVERYQVTMAPIVPTVAQTLASSDLDGADVSSLQYLMSGGAPLPRSVIDKVEKISGTSLLEGYGASEAFVIAVNPIQGKRMAGSVGIRVPYVDLKIVKLDENGAYLRDCDIDEVGVVLVKGPLVFEGYVPETANKNLWPMDGWFNIGDLAKIDCEGYVWISGRAKDLIIRGGHNIDPIIIEEGLQSHSDVQVAAAVGRPDPYAGEVPVCFVQLAPGSQSTAESLLEYASTRVRERAAVPKEIFLVDQIPLTGVGKVFKPALRRKAINQYFQGLLDQALPAIEVSISFDEEQTSTNKLVITLKHEGLPGDESLYDRVNEVFEQYSYEFSVDKVIQSKVQ
ncbi:MAG: acyl-CoA synthetase [Pseudomonadota bacterium]